MKNMHLIALAAALLLFVGCTTEKYGPFEPKNMSSDKTSAKALVRKDYSGGMGHHEGFQKAEEWQLDKQKLIADKTRPEVLAKFVASGGSADALLAKIGTTYDGDPVVLTQIAAVTQFVMHPKCPKAVAGRKVWVAALERARENTDDGYVRTFCDQQLRLCK